MVFISEEEEQRYCLKYCIFFQVNVFNFITEDIMHCVKVMNQQSSPSHYNQLFLSKLLKTILTSTTLLLSSCHSFVNLQSASMVIVSRIT